MDLNAKIDVNKLISDLKDKLNLGPKDIIGIDIGLSAVKLAEVKKVKANEYKLLNYVSVPLPEASLIEDEIHKEEDIVRCIGEGIKQIKSSRQLASIGLSGPNTIARKLQLAGGNYEEIEDQVNWEAEQYLPFPIEDATVSFHIFGENEGGGVDVLVAAAKNTIIQNFKNLIEKANLRVRVVDLNIIAVVNVFELVYKEKLDDPNAGSWIILDLGAQKTQFIIYKKNTLVFSKEINVGGSMITEEIQRQMGVNYQEAEDLKTNGDDKGNLPEEIMAIISDVKEKFFAELKKTIDFYITSTSDDNFKECVLTGGGALTPGMIEGLEGLLGISVSVLNPFEKIDYDKKKFDEEEINKMAFSAPVVLGLAMRELKK